MRDSGDTAEARPIIELYFTSQEFEGDGIEGCFIARLKDDRSIKGVAIVAEDAITLMLGDARAKGLSGDKSDYDIDNWS